MPTRFFLAAPFAWAASLMCLVCLLCLVALSLPAAGQTPPAASQTPPRDAITCPPTGLKVVSQINGDIPFGGPIALDSLRAVQRDVDMEESMTLQLSALGFTLNDDAFWQLVYTTDDELAMNAPRYSLERQLPAVDEPSKVGTRDLGSSINAPKRPQQALPFFRDPLGSEPTDCPSLSVYSMTFEIVDDGGRVVWRGIATNSTLTTSPVAAKQRMSELLINALGNDLRETHGTLSSQ